MNEIVKIDRNTCPLSQTRSSFHSVQMSHFVDVKKVQGKEKRKRDKFYGLDGFGVCGLAKAFLCRRRGLAEN